MSQGIATVGSFGRLNMMAMLRDLLDNDAPIMPLTGAPTDGASGTLAGKAGPGAVVLDVTNGVLYVNSGTKASPVWNSGFAVGLGQMGVARADWDFDVDGGAISAIDLGVTLPDNAIVVGGFVDVITTCTSATDAGTGAISVEGANDIVSAVAIGTGTPWDAGLQAIIPKSNTPESTGIKLTDDRAITFTIAVEAFTAGKFEVFLNYVQSS